MFIENTKATLTKGFVAWIVYAAGAANFVMEYGLGQRLPNWAMMFVLGFVLLGRVVKQESVSGPEKEEEKTEAEKAIDAKVKEALDVKVA